MLTRPHLEQVSAVRVQSNRLSRNNFDLMRLCLAAAVCFSHAYVLTGSEQLAWLARVFSSTIAVKAFFVVSGFLIVMSYEKSSSLRRYASKRCRRIYPAYFTVVLLSAFGLWAVSSLSLRDYFSWTWIRYVAANRVFRNFLQPSLPGVFQAHLVPTVNGSLWTLKIEVMFYLAVPLIVAAVRRIGPMIALCALYGASALYASVLMHMAIRTGSGTYAELARQFPGQLSYFIGGALLYYYLKDFERRVALYVIAAIVVIGIDAFYPVPWLEPIALAIIVIFLGLYFYAGNFGKYGDFSYGLYILHFPIIQLAIGFRVFSDRPWLFFLTVVAASGIGAIALWHLVEKRYLERTGHYRAAAEGAPA